MIRKNDALRDEEFDHVEYNRILEKSVDLDTLC